MSKAQHRQSTVCTAVVNRSSTLRRGDGQSAVTLSTEQLNIAWLSQPKRSGAYRCSIQQNSAQRRPTMVCRGSTPRRGHTSSADEQGRAWLGTASFGTVKWSGVRRRTLRHSEGFATSRLRGASPRREYQPQLSRAKPTMALRRSAMQSTEHQNKAKNLKLQEAR
jgi:hypothetical protein